MTVSQSIRWPAEWEPQAAVWLSWPHNRDTWPGHFERVPESYASFVRAVTEFTPVKLLVPKKVRHEADPFLKTFHRVEAIECNTNDCWIRDYGPTFVIDELGQLAGVDWEYNSWGQKYGPWDDDAKVAALILQRQGIRRLDGGMCVEGGALETDGQGILLTTPDCVLTDTRNPGLTQSAAEQIFRERLGIREVVWLSGGGIEGDDTDGHIDQLARFTSARSIVCAVCDDTDDVNHPPLEANYQQLLNWGKPRGVDVVRLPLPRPRHVNDQRVPECYCNFLITNRLVLVPTFRDPSGDARAVSILKEQFPQHEVRGLDAAELAWGLGAFHCASQQQPAV